MNNFFDIPLYEENNEQHQLSIRLTLEGDKMELTYSDMVFASNEHIIEYAVFDAQVVRQHYHTSNNQDLVARLIMDYSICGNGATVYDDIIAYLHGNGIYECEGRK